MLTAYSWAEERWGFRFLGLESKGEYKGRKGKEKTPWHKNVKDIAMTGSQLELRTDQTEQGKSYCEVIGREVDIISLELDR